MPKDRHTTDNTEITITYMVTFQQECEDHLMRKGQSSTNVAMQTVFIC